MLKARDRFYFVIVMPLDKDGNGPADNSEIEYLTWEVWDQELTTHGSFQYLPDAIDECERLNWEYYQ